MAAHTGDKRTFVLPHLNLMKMVIQSKGIVSLFLVRNIHLSIFVGHVLSLFYLNFSRNVWIYMLLYLL